MFVFKLIKKFFGFVGLIKKLIILAIVGVVVFFAAKWGLKYYSLQKVKLAKQIILQAQTKEQFLVIGKKHVNVTLEKSQNTEGWLKSLLLKHVVSVNGIVEIWYGYDLKKHTITYSYDLSKNCVIAKVQQPEILTAHIVFPLSYKTESGIIYKAINEDQEKDLNDIMQLVEQNAIKTTQQWLQTDEGKKAVQEALEEFATTISEISKNQVKVCFVQE